MSAKAFVDHGFPSGKEFCIRFLSSPEFNTTTLRTLAPSASRQEKKEDIALRIYHALERGELTPNRVLLAYVKQARTWLSLKQGHFAKAVELAPCDQLLMEFGEEGWYGPIKDSSYPQKWYIRTYKISDYVRRGIGEASKLDERYIRWAVIAEIGHNYLALSWNGFTFTSITDDHLDTPAQFPFWNRNYIPKCFDELAERFQGEWEHPNLHQLVLHNMWNKYLNTSTPLGDFHYRWQHLRIRAEAAGVALNAHSSGVAEINVMGLQALSRKLAESALEELRFPDDIEKISHVENAILRALIKEWGTKSYEFSLDRESISREAETESLENKVQSEKLFRAHCYFGLKPNSTTQDSLQHLKCFSGYYGGSTGVLDFLLKEFRLRG